MEASKTTAAVAATAAAALAAAPSFVSSVAAPGRVAGHGATTASTKTEVICQHGNGALIRPYEGMMVASNLLYNKALFVVGGGIGVHL